MRQEVAHPDYFLPRSFWIKQEQFAICAVIYLTETLAKDMSDTLARYKDDLRPAIILIPGRTGSLGIGRDNIQRAIERAVGADIL